MNINRAFSKAVLVKKLLYCCSAYSYIFTPLYFNHRKNGAKKYINI